MRRSLPFRILAAAGLLALALVALVAREGYARATGREAVLAMGAVDPRNLLTGHYVALNLVDDLPPGVDCTTAQGEDPVWIALKPAQGRHQVAGFARERATLAGGGSLMVRGRAQCGGTWRGDGAQPRPSVSLDIGVERFHADQDEAEAMERLLGPRPADAAPQAFAIVSVGRDGRARLKGVIVQGRRVELDWF